MSRSKLIKLVLASSLLVVGAIGAAAVVWIALPETRHNQFIDESVGANVSARIRVMSSADEADLAFAQLGWALYAFEFDEHDRASLAANLRLVHTGGLPDPPPPCQFGELPIWRRVSVGALRWGRFVGSNDNIVTAMIDDSEPRGWICIGYGDRAHREP